MTISLEKLNAQFIIEIEKVYTIYEAIVHFIEYWFYDGCVLLNQN